MPQTSAGLLRLSGAPSTPTSLARWCRVRSSSSRLKDTSDAMSMPAVQRFSIRGVTYPCWAAACAGLFVVWCLDHDRCMGFSVMQDKESPRTPFEVLHTRWEQAPEGALLECLYGCH